MASSVIGFGKGRLNRDLSGSKESGKGLNMIQNNLKFTQGFNTKAVILVPVPLMTAELQDETGADPLCLFQLKPTFCNQI